MIVNLYSYFYLNSLIYYLMNYYFIDFIKNKLYFSLLFKIKLYIIKLK